MKYKPGLDLLRAIAVVWVMMWHAYSRAHFTELGPVGKSGWMGVDLFFALSGFLIGSQIFGTLANGDRLHLGNFYIRRFFRTLPAFWAVLAVYVFWPQIREVSHLQPAWQFLTFTMNVLPPTPIGNAFSHAWSLCVEEQFYIIFPALAILLSKPRSLKLYLIFIVAVAILEIILNTWLWIQVVEPSKESGENFINVYKTWIYYPTYTRLDDLLAGVGLAILRSYNTRVWFWIEENANKVTLLGFVCVLAVIYMEGFEGSTFLCTAIGFPLLAIGMASLVGSAGVNKGILAELKIPGAKWLALTSYSLYLTHKLVIAQLHTRFAYLSEGHGIGTFLIYAACILLVGSLLFYIIEHPFILLRKRLKLGYR